MERKIEVSGVFELDRVKQPFTGTIVFTETENWIQYTWNLIGEQGENLGGKGRTIYFRQIPDGIDKWDFVISHAIENIRRFRIERQRPVNELNITG